VQDASKDAERCSDKEMAAQNVRDLENYEIFIKNQFLLAIIFDFWCFMSYAIARWKGLEE
jgi:hypothetical protein